MTDDPPKHATVLTLNPGSSSPQAGLRDTGPALAAHGVVHGGPTYDRPIIISDTVRDALAALVPWAPLQLPGDICHRLTSLRAPVGADRETEHAAEVPGVGALARTGIRVLVVPADEAAVLDRQARHVLAAGPG